ncbi:VPLPA-CTERM sorting domain-containing protein [Roseobacter sinensis]|uniref:VPLPA-CTERM sorting domain-containing protein n=1 Tax=Roseobacter sinensis TaxID=2931391 RepID=A0ABT3B9T1_9RHOB|nr:VPLPA-CTERM sorting domain-containing protein [Roseobacter sp. WL0113]MCV3270327.1 VPLPA-CTERM sorting domain-containing protein [Roseobacter sp. WL0113]
MSSPRLIAAVAALVLFPSLAPSAPVVFSASGADAASIQAEVDAFRDALGALNPNEPENFDGGRRQINWDAAPDAISDPNPFPGDFFNFGAAPRARGIEFRPSENPNAGPQELIADGFQLSSTEASGEPVRFGFEDELGVFSPERLFAPTGGTIFDVLFFDPADQKTPAATRGLGIIFTNVSETYDETGAPTTDAIVNLFLSGQDIGSDAPKLSFNAEASGPGGLSFLGILFDAPVIVGATVQAGFIPFDEATSGAGVVAMDDFIFGEPTVAPVPLPAGVVLLGSALLGGATVGRRRRRTA